jgi:Ser/Thr protein kinase RdoA (MazF antagonist)
VLKLHQPADADEIALEIAALQHLSAFPEVAARVPQALTTATGDAVVAIDTPDGVRLARGLTWLPGRTWRDVAPGPVAFEGLGRLVAQVDGALTGFDHPHADRALRWNLARAGDALALVDQVEDPAVRQTVRAVLEEFVEDVAPAVAALPGQVIHNDANDANLVLDDTGAVHGLIDFGDLCRAPRVCGLAIACAYAVASVPATVDPWRGLAPLVAGYHAVAPLGAVELALLPALVRTRLAVSLAMAAWQHARDPGNAYLLSSQDAVGAALHRLSGLDDHLALTRLRAATGLEPCPRARAVRDHLAGAAVAPVLGRPLGELAHEIMDWSGPDPAPVEVGPDRVLIGRYREDRSVYTTDAYATPTGERRTVHLGVDLFVPAGRPLHAPVDGVVEACGDNAAPLDYGPVIVLRHDLPDGARFFTLYGHLSRASLHGLHPGTPVPAGMVFATIGTQQENGGWAPHVHLQLFTDLVGLGLDVPGVAPRSELAVWSSLCPDPNLLLGVPEGLDASTGLDEGAAAVRRG